MSIISVSVQQAESRWMLKFIAYSFALMTLMFCVTVTAMHLVGKAAGAQTISVVTSPTRSVANSLSRFHLMDIGRGLKITLEPPLSSIRDVRLLDGLPEALLLVQDFSQPGSDAELYHFDLISRQVHHLFTFRRSANIALHNVLSRAVSPSRDGRLLALYDADDPGTYVLDLETRTTRKVLDGDWLTMFPLNANPVLLTPDSSVTMSWSPDNQQIVVRHPINTSFWVVNVDGSNLREFQVPPYTKSWLPNWSSDSQRIMLTTDIYLGDLQPLRIMDADTGDVHPATADLMGVGSALSCDGERLGYVQASGIPPDIESEGYLLNLAEGTQVNLGEHPLLTGKMIAIMNWLLNCEWLLIVTFPPPQTPSGAHITQLGIYLADPSGQDIQVIHEAAGLSWIGEEGITYRIVSDDDPESNMLYAYAPGGEPKRIPNGENYQLVEWFDNWTWALFMEGSYPLMQRLGVLDARTGNVRYLTEEQDSVLYYVRWR